MMDAESLRLAVEHAGVAAAGVAFLTGLVFSFNPVALASIPVSLAYVTKGRDKGQAFLFGAMFILGMVLTHVVLGLIAGLGGKWAADIAGRGWGLLLGPLLIILGLMWVGWLRIPLPSFGFRASRPAAAWGAFLLGIPFAIAVCPICTPTLVVLLRHRGNRLCLARSGIASFVRSRPRRSDRHRRLRRQLAGKPQPPCQIQARFRDCWWRAPDRDGFLHVERGVHLDSRTGGLTGWHHDEQRSRWSS